MMMVVMVVTMIKRAKVLHGALDKTRKRQDQCTELTATHAPNYQ